MTAPSIVAITNAFLSGEMSLQVAKPAGTLPGHGMLMIAINDGGGIASCAGWEPVEVAADNFAVLAKVAGDSEPANYTVEFQQESDGRVVIVTLQDCDTGTFPHVSDQAATTANAPSVTTTVDECLLILVGLHIGGNSTTQPAGTTSVVASNGIGTCGTNVASKAAETAGATGTNAFGATRSFTATLAIAPVPPTPPSTGFGLGIGFGSFLGWSFP